MARQCPDGHLSQSEDYCDTCGLAIAADAVEPAADADATAPELAAVPGSSQECPNCSAHGPVDALFCEACGYDYTTGTMPRAVEPPSFPMPASLADPGRPMPSQPHVHEGGSSLDLSGPGDGVDADAAGAAGVETGAAGADHSAVVSESDVESEEAADANPAPTLAEPWVAEVWIDPDWYADQGSSDPMPSPGMPTVVLLRHTSSLVGRASRSRGIAPDIDISGDPGVSRRHAQLTTDGSRWFVEDLGSANGTFVAAAAGALPSEPVVAGQKREIASGEQVYVGAWTRIVIRQAAEGEH